MDEHPQKHLFEEVKGLRIKLDDAFKRVKDLENGYSKDITDMDERITDNLAVNKKVEHFYATQHDKVKITVFNKEFIFLKDLFSLNIYNAKFLKEKNQENIVIDFEVTKKTFKQVMIIVKFGHFQARDPLDKNILNDIDEIQKLNVKNKEYLNKLIEDMFEAASVKKIKVDFNL